MNQMRGGFALKLSELRDKLLQFVSLIELELDFAEEDLEFANREILYDLTEQIEKRLRSLSPHSSSAMQLKTASPSQS